MPPANQADFTILGETSDFIAVNKPAGLLVHPTRPDGQRTLWDGLRELLGYELATGGQISIINRLDRETSGVVMVAKHSAAARHAGIAMQNGRIRKGYLALSFGWPEWDELTINAPILRLGEVSPSEVWLMRAVHPQGAVSVTECRVLQRAESSLGRFSLIAARPLTGRTHQIRVHLAHAGFPVVGDKIYARGHHHYLDFIRDGWTRALERELLLDRHALHCSRMQMEDHVWDSPLPQDLANFAGGVFATFSVEW